MVVRCEHPENGTGVRRIRRGYADGKAKPRFDATEGSIGVILPVFGRQACSRRGRGEGALGLLAGSPAVKQPGGRVDRVWKGQGPKGPEGACDQGPGERPRLGPWHALCHELSACLGSSAVVTSANADGWRHDVIVLEVRRRHGCGKGARDVALTSAWMIPGATTRSMDTRGRFEPPQTTTAARLILSGNRPTHPASSRTSSRGGLQLVPCIGQSRQGFREAPNARKPPESSDFGGLFHSMALACAARSAAQKATRSAGGGY